MWICSAADYILEFVSPLRDVALSFASLFSQFGAIISFFHLD